ncbi:cupin domain-containing protein [Psychrobacter ciconiae]|uniref:cupin domain-containing protein n=1 Tax=Psychrobacter ciconiae TaxID=1553449 RepID=UPI00191A8D83|nr:cupin domain-containing protein [Psychrobacter ciconiae]
MIALPLCLPKSMSKAQFLSEYWQKKPLLIKNGLPALVGMFEPEDILGLALEEDASARLITQADSKAADAPQWQVKKSPLAEADFDNLPKFWTVLIQNLEQWSPELGALWQAFDFIPQWQRDDIMVSFAPKGGSVGKHYDDYDVFLAQGFGHRRWQLGKVCDESTEFVAGEPIRIFDDMGEIVFDEVLEAGDVLYVPPKWSHFGVAQDDCLTFSFGCRRPNLMQIIDSLADVATNNPALFTPMLLPQSSQPSGALEPSSIDAIRAQLVELLTSNQGASLIQQAVCEVVSKRQYDALVPEELPTTDELVSAITDGARLKADFSSRLIYTVIDNETVIFANGQRLDDISPAAAQVLMQLADSKALGLEDLNEVDSDEVMDWIENGWAWVDDGELDELE